MYMWVKEFVYMKGRIAERGETETEGLLSADLLPIDCLP